MDQMFLVIINLLILAAAQTLVLTGLRLSAEDKGDHFVLNGEKKWITNGLTWWYLTCVHSLAVQASSLIISLLPVVLVETDLVGCPCYSWSAAQAYRPGKWCARMLVSDSLSIRV